MGQFRFLLVAGVRRPNILLRRGLMPV